MRKLQNTLYITTQGTYLHKERETLLVVEQERKLDTLPALTKLQTWIFNRKYRHNTKCQQTLSVLIFSRSGFPTSRGNDAGGFQ